MPLPLGPPRHRPAGPPRPDHTHAPEPLPGHSVLPAADPLPRSTDKIHAARNNEAWSPTPVSFEIITPPVHPLVQIDERGPITQKAPAAENEPATTPLETVDPTLPLQGPPSPVPEATPVILGPIIDLRARSAEAAPLPSESRAIRSEAPAEVSVVVDRSVILPPAGDERATFASLLGFGEDEVYFGPTATVALDEPTVSPHLVAHVVTRPIATLPTEPQPTAWDELPGLADVALDDSSDTQTLIGRLWDATIDQPILSDVDVAEPLPPDRVFLGSKRWRWSVLGSLAILVVLMFVAGAAVGRWPIEAARELAIEYRLSTQHLADTLGPLDQAASAITSLNGADLDLGGLIAALDGLEGAARDIAALASRPLPKPSPFGSSAELDRLEAPQALLQQAAAAASTVERRLGDALAYRIGLANTFVLPDLPVVATPAEVGSVGADLSVMFASTTATLADLPDDPFFASHREAASALLEDLQERQIEYLNALRKSDSATAGTARRQMVAAVDALRTDVAEPLGAMSRWAEDQLDTLEALIKTLDGQLR